MLQAAHNLKDIQGHIVPGFGAGFQLTCGLDLERIKRQRLSEWALTNATSADVLHKRRASKNNRAGPLTCISVSVSLDYVCKTLGILAPTFNPGTEVGPIEQTALLCLSSVDPCAVLSSFAELLNEIGEGSEIRFCWWGRTGWGTAGDVNPFGFVDGRLQPSLLDDQAARKEGTPAAYLEDFVIGNGFRQDWAYNNFGIDCRQHREALRNGSFLVAKPFAVSPSRFYENLTRIVDTLKVSNPHLNLSSQWLAEQMFGVDLTGQTLPATLPCLLAKHVVKMSATNEAETQKRNRPLIRRGFWSTPDDDGWSRLYFLGFQTSVDDQFSHLYPIWTNDVDHPRAATGPDPILGSYGTFWGVLRGPDGTNVVLQKQKEFVRPESGMCFFTPSISSIPTFLHGGAI